MLRKEHRLHLSGNSSGDTTGVEVRTASCRGFNTKQLDLGDSQSLQRLWLVGYCWLQNSKNTLDRLKCPPTDWLAWLLTLWDAKQDIIYMGILKILFSFSQKKCYMFFSFSHRAMSAALFPRKIDTRPCAGTNLMPSIYPVVNNKTFHKLQGSPWNVRRIRLRARPLLWISLSLSFRLTESVWVGVSREGRRNVKANWAKKTSTTWPKTPPCPRKASKNSTRQVVDVRYDHFLCNETKKILLMERYWRFIAGGDNWA